VTDDMQDLFRQCRKAGVSIQLSKLAQLLVKQKCLITFLRKIPHNSLALYGQPPPTATSLRSQLPSRIAIVTGCNAGLCEALDNHPQLPACLVPRPHAAHQALQAPRTLEAT